MRAKLAMDSFSIVHALHDAGAVDLHERMNEYLLFVRLPSVQTTLRHSPAPWSAAASGRLNTRRRRHDVPIVMGVVHVRTHGLMPLARMGARNTVPSRIVRMVPLGLFHILFEFIFFHALRVGRDGGALDGLPRIFYWHSPRPRSPDRRSRRGFPGPDRNIPSLSPRRARSESSLIHLPQHARHFVAVHLDERRFHLNFFHIGPFSLIRAWRSNSSGSRRAECPAHPASGPLRAAEALLFRRSAAEPPRGNSHSLSPAASARPAQRPDRPAHSRMACLRPA